MNRSKPRRAARRSIAIALTCGLLGLLAGCASTSSGVNVASANPSSSTTSAKRPPSTEGQTSNTRGRSTATTAPPFEPPVGDSVPSIEQSTAAQALLGEVPQLVGDSDSQRKSTAVDNTLKAALQRIADGKATGDSTFFEVVGADLPDGQVVSPYLICPIASGEACEASKEDFESFMKECTGPETKWTAMLVTGTDAWAAAAACIWTPSDADKAAAIDATDKLLLATLKAAGRTVTRSTDLDTAAQAWAASFATAAAGDPTSVPPFAALGTYETLTEAFIAPGTLTDGSFDRGNIDAWVALISSSLTHFGLATVIDRGTLLVLIVAA